MYKSEFAALDRKITAELVPTHGLAGDLASARLGEYGMIASDISANVGRAIRMVIDCESIPSKLQL